jgi:hypothetical protein
MKYRSRILVDLVEEAIKVRRGCVAFGLIRA